MSADEAHHILVVDDDDLLRNQLVRAFERRGHVVASAASAAEARDVAEAFCPTRVVLDLRVPGADDLDLFDAIAEACPDAEIALVTGYATIPTAIRATKRGAVNVVQKPATADEILAAFDGEVQLESPAPSLARAEWEHINRALEDAGGNVSEASRRLGVHRRTLQRKLAKYPPKE